MKIIDQISEWLYRKRMIVPEPLLETLADADYVIAPRFVDVGDYVFLAGNEERNKDLQRGYRSCDETESGKIQTEAIENKVCLFDDVKKYLQNDIKKISVAIAQNLLHCLELEYPEKRFAVFLELKYKDSVWVRFHQIRPGGELYIDPEEYKDEYASGVFRVLL